ncbi:UNVERIFIED_CONTAM: hypothetical protein Sradi_3288500 [Sesamum radiatum]|uniref:Integrase catalytic domain-containing protein n=1 Tax=Sesamum radiatum TaxID=300843 RepID=A0AAW2R2D7_SESRA
MGLDDDVYGTIRSNIIAQEPLALLNRTYALIIQEERHRTLTRTLDVRTEAVSFAVQGPKSMPSGLGRDRNTNSIGHGKGINAVANAVQTSVATGASTTFTPQDKASLVSTLIDDQWTTVLAMANLQDKGTSKEKLSGPHFEDLDWCGFENEQCDICFQAKQTCEFDKYVKVVRSDNGTKFAPLRSYFEENGIEFQTSCVDTPQQNGHMECKRRHILNVGHALHFQKGWSLVASIDNSPSVAAYDDPSIHHSPSPLDLSNSLKSGSENIASPATTSQLTLTINKIWLVLPTMGSPSCVLRRSERSRQPNTRLKDYVCLTARCVDPSFTHYPIIVLSAKHTHFLATITIETEPNQFFDAVKDPRWCDAMAKEIVALESNGMSPSKIFVRSRQAPRNWFAKLAGALKFFGFQQSYNDYSLVTYER